MDFNINQPIPFDIEKTAQIAHHYKEIIRLLGENTAREV